MSRLTRPCCQRLQRLLCSQDRGNALLIAVMVTSVCLGLSLVGVQLAVSSSRSSGVDRQRVLVVNAAEAGIDSGYTAIEAAGLVLPCSLASGDVHAAPDTASYTTTVTYNNAAGVALACPLAAGVTPAQAVIRSAATVNTLGGRGSRPTRVMEALVNLTPQSATGLDKAIFGDRGVDGTVLISTVGNSGANADIYSNSDVNCGSYMIVAGTIYAQNDINTGIGCSVAGNVWAKRNVNEGISSLVGGYAKAGTGTVTAGLLSSITGNLYAGGAISYAGCVIGKCFPNASPGSPPAEPFPIIRSDNATMAAWTAASPGPAYTLYDDNNCGSIVSNIINTYAKKGSKTLVRTTCAVNFGTPTSLVLNNDLAIFAKGGISSAILTSVGSNVVGTKRILHWIVPYDAVASVPCTAPTVSSGAALAVTPDVWMLVYSPCDTNFTVLNLVNGQVYSGSKVSAFAAFAVAYQRVPTYGIDPTSVPATSYSTSVVYKREVR